MAQLHTEELSTFELLLILIFVFPWLAWTAWHATREGAPHEQDG